MRRIFLTLLFLLSIGTAQAFAAEYQLLSPLPGTGISNEKGVASIDDNYLEKYFKTIYRLGIVIATGLAVLMIMWGGIEYITTDAIGGKEAGKERIQSAVLGLLLALGSYVILRTIDPDLLKVKLDIKQVDQGKLNDLIRQYLQSMVASNSHDQNLADNITRGVLTATQGSVSPEAMDAALKAFSQYKGSIGNQRYIGIMDYTKHSSEKRFIILDTQTGEITSMLASNAVNSDRDHDGYVDGPNSFSDTLGSNKSELGAFRTTFIPPNAPGYKVTNCLRLHGLESSNVGANNRGIDIHASDYVESGGRSEGCIGIPNTMQDTVNNNLTNAFIYNYYPGN